MYIDFRFAIASAVIRCAFALVIAAHVLGAVAAICAGITRARRTVIDLTVLTRITGRTTALVTII